VLVPEHGPAPDFSPFCRTTGHELVQSSSDDSVASASAHSKKTIAHLAQFTLQKAV
jgi:hypothetical protein